ARRPRVPRASQMTCDPRDRSRARPNQRLDTPASGADSESAARRAAACGIPMSFALRLLAAVLAFTAVTATTPTAADATFHFVSISELGAGFLGNPNVQFVELRLDTAGQTELTDTRLTSFDKDGVPTVL